jgi:hypothetical protein
MEMEMMEMMESSTKTEMMMMEMMMEPLIRLCC